MGNLKGLSPLGFPFPGALPRFSARFDRALVCCLRMLYTSVLRSEKRGEMPLFTPQIYWRPVKYAYLQC